MKQVQSYLSWLKLTFIVSATHGMTSLIASPKIAAYYGTEKAFSSALISGLLLWVIGFTLISMAFEKRRDAIQNASFYMGNFGGRIVSIFSLISFPIWFVYQIHESVAISPFKELNASNTDVLPYCYGFFLCFLALYLASYDILKILYRASLVGLTMLFVFFLLLLTISNAASLNFTEFTLSSNCIVSYIALSFGGVVNLPTFFKHARSRYDAYLALTLMTIIIFIFQTLSITLYENTGNPFSVFNIFKESSFVAIYVMPVLIFLFLTLLCVSTNLVNIYFAFPSIRFLFSEKLKLRALLFLTFTNTSLYFVSVIFPNSYAFLISGNLIINDLVANLGCTLIFVFFMRLIVKHRPTPLEKLTSAISWLTGCVGTIYAHIYTFDNPLIFGIMITISTFIISFFIEEPFWSAIELRKYLNNNNQSK